METSVGALTVLFLGIVLGFKHATEVDHVVAVSSIVSQHQNIWRSGAVGLLWGLGHTASLFIIGVLVLVFKVSIPHSIAGWFELLVALMIVLLGALGLLGAVRKRRDLHYHRHKHLGRFHTHVHFHEIGIDKESPTAFHSHTIRRVGLKPFIVGSIHGLAGSAALTLLILPQLESVLLGLSYLAAFGLGSVGGMLVMSMLLGLPFALANPVLSRSYYNLQFVAASLSLVFGVWYAYQWSVG